MKETNKRPDPYGRPPTENKPYGQDSLWQRIASFPIDDPQSQAPFSKKLAREQGWGQDFTRHAIEEYRRFLYICCTRPGEHHPPRLWTRFGTCT